MAAEALFEHEGRLHGPAEVASALRAAGVAEGDSILVHSDLKAFGTLAPGVGRAAFCDGFLAGLREALGPSGNLILPTFSYSFCKGQDFDPSSTPSTVGMLTEHFRRQAGVLRSADPIFSVAAQGPDAAWFSSVGTVCFGEGSVFDKLRARRGKLVCMGETLDLTFIHYVEQSVGVPYRYLKRFEGRVKKGQDWQPAACEYYVRSLDKPARYDFPKMARYMAAQGALREAPLGASRVVCAGAAETFEALAAGLARDSSLLLEAAA